MSRAFDGTTYYPGIIGLNNIKANDYANVILHVSLLSGYSITSPLWFRLCPVCLHFVTTSCERRTMCTSSDRPVTRLPSCHRDSVSSSASCGTQRPSRHMV